MARNVQRPDFEVVLRVAGSEVAILAGFAGEPDYMDIIAGVDDPSNKDVYISLLEQATVALAVCSDWRGVPSPRTSQPPF